MKILTVVDKLGSAIHKLALANQKYNTHFENVIIPFHPKRPDQGQIDLFLEHIETADLVDFQYWKTALKILEDYPQYFENKKTVLQHHNPYSIRESDWRQFDRVVVNNKGIQADLPYATLIPNAVEVNEFSLVEPTEIKNKVGMVAARIESSKGIFEVAQAAKAVGIDFQLVGRASDRGYLQKVLDVGNVDFLENVDEEELISSYANIDFLIVNSNDNFESGPLPALEAMASLVPVITRPGIGILPDLDSGENMIVTKDLIGTLRKCYENEEGLAKQKEELAEAAYKSLRPYDSKFRAWRYSKLYYEVLHDQPLVSIVVPTADNPKMVVDIVKRVNDQTYKAIELVLVDDGDVKLKVYASFLKNLLKKSHVPVKYISLDHEYPQTYNLAKARNFGATFAQGEYLLFCDDRLGLAPDAVARFMDSPPDSRSWHFGDKGAQKKSFVENFSIVKRSAFIQNGMFNTVIDEYGGITQETVTRFKRNGFSFKYKEAARAKVLKSSGSRWQRRYSVNNMKFRIYQLYG